MHDDTVDAAATDWLVVNTQPHKETFAVQQLHQQGYATYCPMIAKRVRHARRVRDVNRPLFPSYVFVRWTAQMQWRPIYSTFGVRRVIMRGDRPDVLDGRFIAGLKGREVDGVVRKPAERLVPGQAVTVAGGPLDGLIGEIVSLKDQDRITVLLSLLNNKVRAHLAAEDVRVR